MNFEEKKLLNKVTNDQNKIKANNSDEINLEP